MKALSEKLGTRKNRIADSLIQHDAGVQSKRKQDKQMNILQLILASVSTDGHWNGWKETCQ
jgi:hypothetical protein